MIFRRVMYFILLYAALTYSVLYKTYDGFVILAFFGVVSVISLVMLVLCRLTVRCEFERDVVYVERAREYTLKYRLKNKMPFPLTRVDILFDDLKKPQAFTVGAANSAILTRKDTKKHCGCYTTRISRICLYDCFGVFRFKIKNPGVVKVVALPRLFDVDAKEYIDSMLEAEAELDKNAPKGSEVSEIREYRDGDSLKNIHHKLSSRMSRLMVKEYVADDGNDDGFLFLETDNADPDMRDRMLELMYNMMYMRVKTKGKTTGYIPADGAAVSFTMDSKEMLDEYFGHMLEVYENGDGGQCDIPAGTFVFAAALSDRLYNMGSVVLYLPDSEYRQDAQPDVEVIYVSAGGGRHE